MTTNFHKVRQVIAKSDLQRLINKLNVGRRELGVEPIPSVDELQAKEPQNNTAIFEFVKAHFETVFDAAAFGVNEKEADKTIDNSTKAIIKFFEEQS